MMIILGSLLLLLGIGGGLWLRKFKKIDAGYQRV